MSLVLTINEKYKYQINSHTPLSQLVYNWSQFNECDYTEYTLVYNNNIVDLGRSPFFYEMKSGDNVSIVDWPLSTTKYDNVVDIAIKNMSGQDLFCFRLRHDQLQTMTIGRIAELTANRQKIPLSSLVFYDNTLKLIDYSENLPICKYGIGLSQSSRVIHIKQI